MTIYYENGVSISIGEQLGKAIVSHKRKDQQMRIPYSMQRVKDKIHDNAMNIDGFKSRVDCVIGKVKTIITGHQNLDLSAKLVLDSELNSALVKFGELLVDFF